MWRAFRGSWLLVLLLVSAPLASDKRVGQIVSSGTSACLTGLQNTNHFVLYGPASYYYRTGNCTLSNPTAVNTDPPVQANALFDTWTQSDENCICILPTSGAALTVQVAVANPQ